MKAVDYLKNYINECIEAGETVDEANWEKEVRKAYFDQTMDKSEDSEAVMDHVMHFQHDMVLPFSKFLEETFKLVYGTPGPVNPLITAEKFMSVQQMAFIASSYCTTEALNGKKLNRIAGGLSRHAIATMRANVYMEKKIGQEEKQSKLDKIENLEKVGFSLAELFFNRFGEYHDITRVKGQRINYKGEDIPYTIREMNEEVKFFQLIEKPVGSDNQTPDKVKSEHTVELNPVCRALLNKSLNDLGWEAWANPPMIWEPNAWGREGKSGGYQSDFMQAPLVKKHSDRSPTDYRHTVMSQEAIDSVNAIQATPWRVNDFVYGVMKDLMLIEPETLTKLFPVDIPPPAKDASYLETEDILWGELTDVQQALRKLFGDQMKYMKKANNGNGSRRISRNSSMDQAEVYEKFPEFYFPYQVDYRGRIYSMAMSGLNPQGADAEKGLIELANGRRVKTLKGEQWLKINMANLMGFDKATLAERIAFTNENEDLIRSVVHEPLVNTEWHDWDKPVQGLGCANEYVKWLDDKDTELHIHVQLDGLCNGLQHLTAIANDDKAAPELGLIESEERGDIYSYVQRAVESQVSRIINKGPGDMDYQYAKEWMDTGQIDRDLCKKPVMTKGYSATLRGMEDGTIEKLLARGVNGEFEDYKKAGKWMAGVIWDAMDEAVNGACKVMEWFQAVASVVGKSERALEWSTPNGSGCYYAPRTSKSTSIEVNINRSRKKFKQMVASEKIHTSNLKSGISPNIIHSFDASHLMLTVEYCLARGITDFAFVHDSFGTHPDDAQALLDEAKQAWIGIYSMNQLDRLHAEWTAIYAGHDIPHWGEYVTMGYLDAEQVKGSDFFFA